MCVTPLAKCGAVRCSPLKRGGRDPTCRPKKTFARRMLPVGRDFDGRAGKMRGPLIIHNDLVLAAEGQQKGSAAGDPEMRFSDRCAKSTLQPGIPRHRGEICCSILDSDLVSFQNSAWEPDSQCQYCCSIRRPLRALSLCGWES